MKILVAIANYGTKNDRYLARLLTEFRSMPYEIDLVVLSNLKKDLGADVEMVVGVPQKNPWSMPFGHRRIFAERQDAYDLFLYTEDDMLVTERNIAAFLRATSILPREHLAGFFQTERYPDGRTYFPGVHSHFHWDAQSVKVIGGQTFARFTNDHSACYLLTRAQLKDAIASGGFLVDPHEGQEDMLVSAATDPYTQCGFSKLLCLSNFEDFLVAHLPNRYINTAMGLEGAEFHRQIQHLLRHANNGIGTTQLLKPETKLFHRNWSKNYYEPCRHDLIGLLPSHTRSVLSIGCGWGATEAKLVAKGIRVTGIPLDGVIAACAQSRGIETVCDELDKALARLAGQRFDGILLSGILHLLPEPAKTLTQASKLLSENGRIVVSVPNLHRLPFLWRRLRYPSRYKELDDFERSGMHAISRGRATKWLTNCGLEVERVFEAVLPSWKRAVALSGGLAARVFSMEFAVVASNQRPIDVAHT